jgi:hypothetical protein
MNESLRRGSRNGPGNWRSRRRPPKPPTGRKAHFLANMSHEIRTPMTAILGLADLMKLDGVTARQAERLNKMNGAAQHLLGIINDVLDLAKIEAGKLVLDESEFDVGRLVESVVAMTADRARQKHLTCERLRAACRAPCSATRPASGRPAQLRQQCDPLHRTGQRHHPSAPQEESGDRLLLRFEVERYRHRHRRQRHRAALPQLRAGRQLDDPGTRRHRSRPRHRPPDRRDDGGQQRGRQYRGRRQHLLVHRLRCSGRVAGGPALACSPLARSRIAPRQGAHPRRRRRSGQPRSHSGDSRNHRPLRRWRGQWRRQRSSSPSNGLTISS